MKKYTKPIIEVVSLSTENIATEPSSVGLKVNSTVQQSFKSIKYY